MKIFKNITNGYRKIASGIAIVAFLALMYFALIPGGTVAVSGVFTASGVGIGNAFVKLVDYPQYNATTDSNGLYTMLNVPEGTYTIRASADGFYPNISTVTVTGGQTVTKDLTLGIAYKVFVPWTATTQGWTTPYVIANKGSSTANVLIDYYNQADGSKVGNYSVNILPGASKFVFRQWNTSTDGSAVLLSNEPIAIMVDQFGTNLFAAYEVEPSGSNEVFLPWTAATGGWTTPFVIVNRGNVNASITVTYYSITGGVAGSSSLEIQPGASKFVFREWATVSDGAAKISSTQNISVLADMFGPGNKFAAYTPASIADINVTIPWTATTQGWSTPYKIVNRGLNPAVVNIKYYNQANGQQVGTDSVTINPNGVATISRESSAANGTDGSAVLTSSEPISVIVQQLSGDGKFEVYTPAMTASNNIVIPWTATTQGWTTPYVIVNKGTASATVNINYYNQADGSNAGSHTVNNLLPGASTFVFRESSAPSTDGSAVLVSNQPITAMVDQFAGNLFGAYTPLG